MANVKNRTPLPSMLCPNLLTVVLWNATLIGNAFYVSDIFPSESTVQSMVFPLHLQMACTHSSPCLSTGIGLTQGRYPICVFLQLSFRLYFPTVFLKNSSSPSLTLFPALLIYQATFYSYASFVQYAWQYGRQRPAETGRGWTVLASCPLFGADGRRASFVCYSTCGHYNLCKSDFELCQCK